MLATRAPILTTFDSVLREYSNGSSSSDIFLILIAGHVWYDDRWCE
jgi:hypothetical protein